MEYYLKKQLLIAAIMYIGQMAVGYSLGWSAPVIPKLQDEDQTTLPRPITEGQSSWIGSVLYIGTIIGPFTATYISNIFGRKPCFVLGGVLFIVALLLLGLAKSFPVILAGRIVTGIGAGIIANMNLVYLGEIASTNIRGLLLTGTGIFSTLGTLVVYSVGPYVSYSAISYVGLGIVAVYMLGLFFIPETPVFHILKENEDEAKNTLISLGRELDIDILLRPEKKQKPEENKRQWRDLILIKNNRRALTITLTLNVMQQLSGVVAVVFFVTTIFELAESSIEPGIATIIIGITQLVASSICPFFVERNGRRILLLVSTGLCCISLALLGTYFFLDHMNYSLIETIQWLPLVILIVFFITYDLGFGIIPNTLVGELFQPSVRSSGMAVTAIVPYMVGFGVSTAFGYMIAGVGGHVTFWIFSGFCAVAFFFTAFYVPETKGKTFDEIQLILSK